MKDSYKKLIESKKQIKKLSKNLPDDVQYETFTVNGVPEIWCPKIRSKIKLVDLPNIGSKKIININGGTP